MDDHAVAIGQGVSDRGILDAECREIMPKPQKLGLPPGARVMRDETSDALAADGTNVHCAVERVKPGLPQPMRIADVVQVGRVGDNIVIRASCEHFGYRERPTRNTRCMAPPIR
jgi:hypothetical protein